MSFNWLKDFHQDMVKGSNYAEKTLAAYRLGMRAKGSIRGVRIEVDGEGCPASRSLDPDAEFSPDDAPHLPLPECSKGLHCRCVYRPVMSYEPREE
ncbi:MAG: hypothetical protein KC410_08870 [Anaerolineales bacterium]|nr:hypothetical protein [Anaerolineales bacterium]MCB8934586.1 hypothetical protein [Promineifilum sp.]